MACRPEAGQPDVSQTEANEAVLQEELPEGFADFYYRFHRDSAFQMSRIAFPLQGQPALDDSTHADSSFRWQREDWTLHRPFDLENSGFQRQFYVMADNAVIEIISAPSVGLSMERRFGKLSDGWNLIYYSAVNRGR